RSPVRSNPCQTHIPFLQPARRAFSHARTLCLTSPSPGKASFRNQWQMVPVEQPMYGGRSNLQAHDRGAVGGREDRPRQDPAIVAALRVAADPLMAMATWEGKRSG